MGQGRGGWKIEDFSPTGALIGWSTVRWWNEVLSTAIAAPRVPHRSRFSGLPERVEIGSGRGMFEQLGPEQGVRAGEPGGDCSFAPRSADDAPFKIRSWSW
jgi:hypothetical protein